MNVRNAWQPAPVSFVIRVTFYKKKVLLRERKRHSTRCIASTPSAVLSWGRGTPSLAGGYPILAWWGYPIPSQGVPYLGLPLSREGTWDQSLGYTPLKGHGTSRSIMRWKWGTSQERTWDQWKYYGMEMGYLLPDVDWQTNWNYYLPPSFGCGW